MVEAARRRGEVAIGYRILARAHDPGAAWGVKVNPDKTARISFSREEEVIALAED